MTKQMDYLSEEIIILALRRCLGNLDMTAMELGCSRGQLNDYIVNHPAVREEKQQIKEALVDKAEDLLIKRMENSDPLLMFFLRTQGKSRGYDAGATAPGGNSVNVNVSVNARTLIAAMRNGSAGRELVDASEEDENSESNEGSNVLELTDFHSHGE